MTLVADCQKVAEASLVRSAADSASYPGLDRAGQKLARGLAELLGSLMAAPAVVTAAPVRIEEADTSVEVAHHLRLAPLKGTAAFTVSRLAIVRLVDLYYGGEGANEAPRDRLSPAEKRLFARIASGFCPLLAAALQPFADIRAGVCEDPEPGDGRHAVQAFTVIFAGHPPFELQSRYPVAMLEALPGLRSVAPTAADPGDHGWQARLMECALDVAFPVRAVFAEREMPLATLMNLREGDVLPICLPAGIDLKVAGLRLAFGSAGESNGRAAISIDHL